MRNTLAFLAAAAIALGAVGYYLDWFSVRSVASRGGHRTYTVDVNTEKIEEDVRHTGEEIKHKIDEKAEQSKKAHESTHAPRMPGADVVTNVRR